MSSGSGYLLSEPEPPQNCRFWNRNCRRRFRFRFLKSQNRLKRFRFQFSFFKNRYPPVPVPIPVTLPSRYHNFVFRKVPTQRHSNLPSRNPLIPWSRLVEDEGRHWTHSILRPPLSRSRCFVCLIDERRKLIADAIADHRCSTMESSRIDVDLDGESEAVEQNKVSVVGDKRTSNAWRNYTDVRDPKTGKIVKAQSKHCSRILTVTTKNGTSSLGKHTAFCIPSRFTVARDISKVFLCETEQLRNALKSLNSRIALTTDCWTSVQNLSYMCLTAHFIDDNWKLHKRILNFRNIDSHKGKEIGKEVESCILYWGIEEKLSCITVDNASANDVVVAHIKDNLMDKLVLGGEFFHMRCATHILNLIVKDGLDLIKDAIVRIRGAVRYVRSSTVRSKLFDTCVSKSKISSKASVSLDVPTRWNATYIMLETTLKFERAFKRMRQEDPAFEKDLKDGFPSQKDWESARNLSLCLKQFFEATKRMSGTLYVTDNMHYHEILGVLASLLEWTQDEDINIVLMGDQIRKKFDKYYGDFGKTNVMVLVAVALDPRYKMRFVKFSLRKIYPLDFKKVEELYSQVFEVLNQLYNHYSNVSSRGKNDGSSSFNTNDNDGQSFDGVVKNKQMRKIYDEFFENDVEDAMEKSELEEYLDAPPEKMNNETFDILKWWSDKCTTYKVLASMAKDILAIPVSTVASESTFSTSGRVVDDFRSNLLPKTVEALIFTQDWLRASNVCIDLEQLLEDVEKYEEEISRNMEDTHGGNK
ncbi:unnamed protein product [Lactuca saligna]|uniref:Zinc finger BED domain-containing protein RICESLEEPER 2-like n=1 Tax=Lactuca saligna TaxID=75948 RepID=A0AA35YTG9_LACSI|nr:unnamed protein product [Lactuca saligna]